MRTLEFGLSCLVTQGKDHVLQEYDPLLIQRVAQQLILLSIYHQTQLANQPCNVHDGIGLDDRWLGNFRGLRLICHDAQRLTYFRLGFDQSFFSSFLAWWL